MVYLSATVCCNCISNSARSIRSVDCFNLVVHSTRLSLTIKPPKEPRRKRVSISSRSFLNEVIISVDCCGSFDVSGFDTDSSDGFSVDI